MEPLISVIVPVFNVRNVLKRCLDSICNQTYRNLEIICVDDGSTDGSDEILRDYSLVDSRIKLFKQNNKGVSVARNKGLDNAVGDWVTFVDSDDFLDLDAYEYCLPSLRLSEPSVVCFGVRKIHDDCVLPYRYGECPVQGLHKITAELIKRTNVFVFKLFRREVIESLSVRFPEGLRFEDEAFHYYLFPYIGMVMYLPEKKYNYVSYSSSSSFIQSVERGSMEVFDLIKVLECIYKKFSHHPLTGGMQNIYSVLFVYYIDCFRYYSKNWATEKIKEEFRKKICDVVDKCDVLHYLQLSPKALSYYYMPDSLRKYYEERYTAIELLCIESDLLRTHRYYKWKTFIALGKRRRQYRELRRKYSYLISRCKEARKRLVENYEI